MAESPRLESGERENRRGLERAHRRRVARNRAVALVLAAATLVLITVVSANPPPPPTELSAVGSGPSHLAAGSAAALPGNILVADRDNNRLAVISPHGQLAWTKQIFGPTDVFLSPSRASIIVTQRGLFAVLKYGVSSGRLDYVYGKPGQPGAGYDRLRDPASAQQLRGGMLVVADESNCRVLVLRPPSRRPTRVLGSPRSCVHRPPVAFGHPDAAFPTRGGGLIVTELMPAWVDLLSQSYRLIAALRVPGLSSPLDANEFAPGEIVATSHSYPGAVEELTTAGRVLWRFAPASGPGELNFPSLAQVLPDGDVLICDSGNDRIIVVNPRTREIVWQYGHTGRPGRRAGYLDAPESAVLLPAPTR